MVIFLQGVGGGIWNRFAPLTGRVPRLSAPEQHLYGTQLENGLDPQQVGQNSQARSAPKARRAGGFQIFSGHIFPFSVPQAASSRARGPNGSDLGIMEPSFPDFEWVKINHFAPC